eukprot:6074654-Pleurochrysis_carterae.AAC.1
MPECVRGCVSACVRSRAYVCVRARVRARAAVHDRERSTLATVCAYKVWGSSRTRVCERKREGTRSACVRLCERGTHTRSAQLGTDARESAGPCLEA